MNEATEQAIDCWIEGGALRTATIVRHSKESAKRGSVPAAVSLTVTIASGSGGESGRGLLEISATAESVDRAWALVADQLRTIVNGAP